MVVGYQREVATSIVRSELKLLLFPSPPPPPPLSYLMRLDENQTWSILTKISMSHQTLV